MVSVAALVLLLVALAVWLLRRRSRAGSDYTAAP
jgi:cbb3-type cytochrome oxidase subunit 3